MKIAVMNFSGNVGKSTVAKYLLAPRMPKVETFIVETINDSGSTAENMKGKEFGQLQEVLAVTENAIVDIGSSNVETLMTLMKQYHGSHEEFDYFVLPTTNKHKQQNRHYIYY